MPYVVALNDYASPSAVLISGLGLAPGQRMKIFRIFSSGNQAWCELLSAKAATVINDESFFACAIAHCFADGRTRALGLLRGQMQHARWIQVMDAVQRSGKMSLSDMLRHFKGCEEASAAFGKTCSVGDAQYLGQDRTCA